MDHYRSILKLKMKYQMLSMKNVKN